LSVEKGQEAAAIDGYLLALNKQSKVMDAADDNGETITTTDLARFK